MSCFFGNFFFTSNNVNMQIFSHVPYRIFFVANKQLNIFLKNAKLSNQRQIETKLTLIGLFNTRNSVYEIQMKFAICKHFSNSFLEIRESSILKWKQKFNFFWINFAFECSAKCHRLSSDLARLQTKHV